MEDKGKNDIFSDRSQIIVYWEIKYTLFPPKTTGSPYSLHCLAHLSFQPKDQFKEVSTMSRRIKILHIDPEYRITYLIYRHNSSIRTSVPPADGY